MLYIYNIILCIFMLQWDVSFITFSTWTHSHWSKIINTDHHNYIQIRPQLHDMTWYCLSNKNMQILLPDRPMLSDLYLLDLYFVYNTKTFDAFHMLIQTYAFNVFTNKWQNKLVHLWQKIKLNYKSNSYMLNALFLLQMSH